MKSVLVLEDGTYFPGEAFGQKGEAFGEVIFNTCMSGYQEIITDPSYRGQIVAMTYPLIGNYGFNNSDNESEKAHIQGFIVKELCEAPNNWRCSMTPEEYFIKNGIVGIKGIDTRALTQHIRSFGSMPGIISTESGNVDMLLEKLKAKKAEKHLPVMEVTTKTTVHKPGIGKKVVILDLGIKSSILQALEHYKYDIFILPAFSSYGEIMKFDPDGIVISNGPGDPADLKGIVTVIQKLIGKKPLFGISLGHQLLGLALGGTAVKLKFGHHGGNYPVKDIKTGRCNITTQSHNYVLENNFSSDIMVTHVNINDGTIEGIGHRDLPILGVQYNPIATKGSDVGCVYDEFMKLI